MLYTDEEIKEELTKNLSKEEFKNLSKEQIEVIQTIFKEVQEYDNDTPRLTLEGYGAVRRNLSLITKCLDILFHGGNGHNGHSVEVELQGSQWIEVKFNNN